MFACGDHHVSLSRRLCETIPLRSVSGDKPAVTLTAPSLH